MIAVTLSDLPKSLVYAYSITLGLVGGSFINVVIHRLPRGMNLARPGSHCPKCGARVRFYDNVPLLSYIVLRGKARCCGSPISARYPVVELASGALAFAILQSLLLRLPGETSAGRAAAIFVADLMFALALLAVTFIDLEHMYVPDAISLGGTVFGLATFSLRPALGFFDALLGAAAGFGMVWLPFGLAYRWIRGRTGMGLGDAKLVMMAGAWFGWPGAAFSLLAGAVQGTVVALVLIALRGRIEEPEAVKAEKRQVQTELETLGPEERAAAEAELAKDPLYEAPAGSLGLSRIAFGPFLALAMLEYLLIGRESVGDYLRWVGIAA
jgi:leader peptidase (prepilin peptidase)/N-methyltransferase